MMVAATIPSRWYWDPDIYAVERKNIFARQWLCIGREEEVADPGQYLTATTAGYPVFVLRTREGELRGFHNVCRHRAAKLLCSRHGKYISLTCPYHGWQYSDNGLLLNAPYFSSYEELATKDLSLFALQVETWSGMIFINMDLEAPTLIDCLGSIATAVKETAPASLEFYRDVEFKVSCNWKNYIDNYQEGYHIPMIHPGLNRDLDWKEYKVTNHARGSLHQSLARNGSTHPGSFGWHFPNFAFNSYHHGVSFLRIEPKGARHTLLTYSFFRPTNITKENFQNIFDYGIEVSKEDQRITPLVQENLEAGIYDTGPLSPTHETGVFHFHELIRKAIDGDLSQ